MTYPIDAMNRRAYARKDPAKSFTSYRLQTTEVIILVKYRDSFWDKRVLDVGCGAGRTTLFLKNFTAHYTGIDYSSAMIELCRNKFRGMRFVLCDVRDMAASITGEFDFVLFSYNGLDSMGHEDRLRGLQQIEQVLSSDGIFVFSSHNRRYRKTNFSPRLRFCGDPLRQAKHISDFVISRYNHAKNKKHEIFHADYSILNGVSYNFGVMTYHIDKSRQVSQLKQAGLQVVEMYDEDGTVLSPESDDSHSAWIYYVARKTG